MGPFKKSKNFFIFLLTTPAFFCYTIHCSERETGTNGLGV